MTIREHDRAQPIRLGLRENLAQFSLLVAVNALVGGMIGQERTVLPLLATRTFHLTAFTATLTFIVAFGAVKAATNFFAGTLSDRFGRKPVLVAGWLIGLPVPLLIIWAPSWSWIVFANVLLGVNQGLTWSTTVIMKIDLVGPERRGLAMGLNEAAGYGAVALTALATGFIAQNAGLRPEPFFLGIAYAALGLALSTLFVRETRDYAHQEARDHDANTDTPRCCRPPARCSCSRASANRPCRRAAKPDSSTTSTTDSRGGSSRSTSPTPACRSAASVCWPRCTRPSGVSANSSPARSPIASAASGSSPAACSSKRSRSAAIAATTGFGPWMLGAMLLGIGTAMVYPTLLAAIGDVAHPLWRARAVGVYRLWRDAGFAVGAILAGVIADTFSVTVAIWAVAALTALSGLVVVVRMYETHAPRTAVALKGTR